MVERTREVSDRRELDGSGATGSVGVVVETLRRRVVEGPADKDEKMSWSSCIVSIAWSNLTMRSMFVGSSAALNRNVSPPPFSTLWPALPIRLFF